MKDLLAEEHITISTLLAKSSDRRECRTAVTIKQLLCLSLVTQDHVA
ncbi:hypothetical protein ABN584_23215 [Gloeocapsa sp. BRSZ]